MEDFEPMRDFFHRRAAKKLNDLAAGVRLMNQRTESHRGNFVFPGSDYLDDIEIDNQLVGEVDYGINPLGDRLYINMIEIHPEYRRKGIALGVLWNLWLKHQVHIVPISQYGTSYRFWSLARARFAAAGACIEGEIRGDDELDLAKQRWQHLVPESENERSIRKYWEWVASEHAAGRPAGPGIL